jgi:hypothetical protein
MSDRRKRWEAGRGRAEALVYVDGAGCLAVGVSIVALVDVVWLFLSAVDLCQDSGTGTDEWCRDGSKANFYVAVALMGFVLAVPLISCLGHSKASCGLRS